MKHHFAQNTGRQQSLVSLQTSLYAFITDLRGIFDEEGGHVG